MLQLVPREPNMTKDQFEAKHVAICFGTTEILCKQIYSLRVCCSREYS